jgi:hypothetical protein
MLLLDDGEQVGLVPAAVTEMDRCFLPEASVLGMTNVQINIFKEAYGEQADMIPAPGMAFDRANKILYFLTGLDV